MPHFYIIPTNIARFKALRLVPLFLPRFFAFWDLTKPGQRNSLGTWERKSSYQPVSNRGDPSKACSTVAVIQIVLYLPDSVAFCEYT